MEDCEALAEGEGVGLALWLPDTEPLLLSDTVIIYPLFARPSLRQHDSSIQHEGHPRQGALFFAVPSGDAYAFVPLPSRDWIAAAPAFSHGRVGSLGLLSSGSPGGRGSGRRRPTRADAVHSKPDGKGQEGAPQEEPLCGLLALWPRGGHCALPQQCAAGAGLGGVWGRGQRHRRHGKNAVLSLV